MVDRKLGLQIWMLAIVALVLTTGLAAQNINLGLSLVDGKVKSFYLGISSYFGVPEARVLEVQKIYRLPDEELPVVFFIAARARVEPAVVMNLRLKGMSWWDISLHFGLTPEVFFVEVGSVRVGPPYGRAYGYYFKYRERNAWDKVVLSDIEVVNLVNLKFISEYHKIPPERVIEMRGRGEKFLDIHEKIMKEKGKANSKGPSKSKNQPGKKGKK
ncbi:MAG: hypothetical protein H5U06_05885 [Candidatus Aminicenantes bacterium]|nr:hypothetical protein [Candidatus Aminicenantes bacterium]